jgi:CelD/BcsL family acetyltransferase involved in cellulose biosynthesis
MRGILKASATPDDFPERVKGSASLEARWVEEPGGWLRYREGWDERVESSADPSIFSTWDFLETSWLHFARPFGNSLAVIALLEEGRPLGFVPLRIARSRHFGLEVRRLRALASWNSDRPRPIFPRGREAACAAATVAFLEERARDWDVLELEQLSRNDVLGLAVHDWARRAGHELTTEATSPSPYFSLEGTEGTGDVMSRLGSRMRESIRRHRRRLEAQGECTLSVFEKPEEIGRALDMYLEMERRSWKPEARQGAGKDERNTAFYRELLPRLAREGRATVMFLTQGGKQLAGEISYRLGGVAYGNQWTFDRAYSSFSPGNLLKALALQWHASHGVRRYEMYARFLENKLRWTSTTWENATVRVFQTSGLRRWVAFTPGRLKRRLRRGIPASEES